MLRILLASVVNLFVLVLVVFRLPVRLFRGGRPPSYVRFVVEGDPPYRSLWRWNWRRLRKHRARIQVLEVFRRQLARLAAEPRVKGIVLEVKPLGMAPAKRLLVAQWLRAFRTSGKEVVGFAVAPGNSEYALLCAADRVVLPRPGRLSLDGFLLEGTAVGGALERLGIRAEFVRRGEYKTAPELFTRVDVSPAQRALIEALLDDRHGELVEAVTTGRRLDAAVATERVNRGPYSAERALAAGLVDALADETELPALLGMVSREQNDGVVPGFAAFARSRWVPPDRWRRMRPLARLAVVPVAGVITEGEGSAPPRPPVAGAETLLAGLRAARDDARCPAVLLYVDSPGGSALASERIGDEVERLASRKPVVAYTDRVSASGGYLVSLGAREVWAGPQAVVGSIGVFAGKFDASGLLERLGIRRTAFTRGEHAGMGTLSRGMTEAERAALELEVEEMYRRFVDRVARSRKMEAPAVLERAEGRVFTAQRALAEGLLDRLGTFEEAAARALELAGVTPPAFDMVAHGLPPARFDLAALLTRRAQVLALWWPWLTGEGLGGSEDFGGGE
jgi:protease IV